MNGRNALLSLLAFPILAACSAPTTKPASSASGPPTHAPAAPARDETPAARVSLPEALTLSEEGRRAVEVLARAPAYGGAAVGYAGTPTAEVAALRTLLAEARAAEALELVIDQGTLAAQLMALSGLYVAAPARFEARVAPYRALNETVKVRRDGCSMQSDVVPVHALVSRPDAVKLEGPSDTLQGWSQRNPGKGLVFDIAGGGYPRYLAGTATRGS